MGELLSDFIPNLDHAVCSKHTPELFQQLGCIVADARINDLLTDFNWRNLTNKMVYKSHLDSLSAAKIELDSGSSLNLIWHRLSYSCLSSEIRDILYLLVHEKLPVCERLFRCGLANDPYCETCINIRGASDSICDFEHFFCSCVKVSSSWPEIQKWVLDILPQQVPNKDLINFRFPKSAFDTEVTWLLGSYIYFVWMDLHVRQNHLVDSNKFFGFLKFKYKKDQLGARAPLNIVWLAS